MSTTGTPWAHLPLDQVIRLDGLSVAAIDMALDVLPDDAPAVVTYRPPAVASTMSMITEILEEFDAAAMGLFPAWLPGAELIHGPAGVGVAAVRMLATRNAASSPDFGPFLADLAERSLRGGKTETGKFLADVRAVGLARVIASSYGRDRMALLVLVPEGLTPPAEHALVAACEWLSYHGQVGTWLAGAPLHATDRVAAVRLDLAGMVAEVDWETTAAESVLPRVSYPALAGRPHPASLAERKLEAALAIRPWATGRAWNQIHHFGPLVNPVRVDLIWTAERCVVEVDGPEHHTAERYEEDRRRDVELHLDGYTVLRFTNRQIYHDLDGVLLRIERFIHSRRHGMREGYQK